MTNEDFEHIIMTLLDYQVDMKNYIFHLDEIIVERESMPQYAVELFENVKRKQRRIGMMMKELRRDYEERV